MVLPFWYRLTQVVQDKGPLNACMYVMVIVVKFGIEVDIMATSSTRAIWPWLATFAAYDLFNMVLSSCQIWPLSVLADCLWHAAGFAAARSCLRVIVLYSVSATTGWRPVTVVCIVQVVREEDIAEFFEQLQQRKRQKTEQLAMQYYCKWTASVPQPPTLKWTAVCCRSCVPHSWQSWCNATVTIVASYFTLHVHALMSHKIIPRNFLL